MLSKWKATVLKGLPTLFDERRRAAAIKAEHEAELEQLFGQIGRLSTQVTWLKKNLA
jgi:putative transposase